MKEEIGVDRAMALFASEGDAVEHKLASRVMSMAAEVAKEMASEDRIDESMKASEALILLAGRLDRLASRLGN